MKKNYKKKKNFIKEIKRKKSYKKIYSAISNRNISIKEIVEKRYNILIVIIIATMLIILINLFSIQILKHNYYVNKVDELSIITTSSTSTPRGRIYDRTGKIIVDNEAVKVIYYKKPANNSTQKEIETAYKVSSMILLDYTKLSKTDLKKFWIKTHSNEAKDKITNDEWKELEQRRLTDSDIEYLKLERITDKELSELSEKDKLAAYIYYLMNLGYSYDEKVIKKENVTDEEYATIAENVDNIEGFDVRLDWQRVYPYGDVFKTILGSVSTNETGIPYELKDYYLNLGYSLNDRVGISYLEYQYESVLKGTKTNYKILDDGSREVITEGNRGNDIVLTIDIELQKQVEEILTEELLKAREEPNTKYYDHSFVVIANPNTGEVLAMAGKQIVNDNGQYKIYDYTPGAITTSVTAGSIVKGASQIVGYNTGAVKIGEKRLDRCIKIANTPKKCSWTTLGVVDDITALKFSSNVYQFLTAINVGGGTYDYDKPLNINTNAFSIYRNTFSEFGLGVLTGIDLPNESLGYKGTSLLSGHLLDFAIGQYDTYTPIELSQYINTIANGGYRLKPYLLKSVYKPTKEPLTQLLYETEPVVLNKVNTSDLYLNRVKEGFRQVIAGGTGVGYINSIYNAAGKTGTSESFLDTDGDGNVDSATTSNTFAAYAPYDNPKVSFTVISPDVYYNEGTSTKTSVNKRISYEISQKYFELYQ